MGVIRELSAQGIEDLLDRAIIARIACCDHGAGGTTRPYMVPIAFGYDGNAIYFHSGPGRKLDLMRVEPLVTVEVDEGIAPDHWDSVIADGTFEELIDTADQTYAQHLMFPSPDEPPQLAGDGVFVRIRLTGKSGRYERPK